MSNLQSEGELYGLLDSYNDTIDYNALTNRPQINNKVVEGTHNGIYYGLTESEVIDWVDYEALPEDTKKNGKIYYIRNVETHEEKTITNAAIASFDDGSSNPLVSLKIDIEPFQEGSGTPSPGNIRSIRGWSSAEVTVSGTNIWDEEWELGVYSLSDGSPVGSNYSIRCKNRISVKPNTQYYFNNQYFRTLFYDSNDALISYVTGLGVKTTPSNCFYIRFYIGDAYGTIYNNDISINYPSTDTAYHEHEGTSETIALGQTVYGGKLNATTGKLTITDGYIASYNGETLPSTWISDRDEYIPNTSPTTGAEVVYKLATPTEITLPPTEVTILSGTNNILSNVGNIDELRYLTPTIEIENQIRTNDEIFGRA